MKTHHYLMIVVLLILGYMAGVMWPSFGQKLRSTVGM